MKLAVKFDIRGFMDCMEEVGVNGRERDREEGDGSTWMCAGGERHGSWRGRVVRAATGDVMIAWWLGSSGWLLRGK